MDISGPTCGVDQLVFVPPSNLLIHIVLSVIPALPALINPLYGEIRQADCQHLRDPPLLPF